MTPSVLQSGLLPSPTTEGQETDGVLLPGTVAEVYEAHVDYVFRCLRSLGIREAHVEDAVQDVFLVVNDKLAAFDGKAKLRTWLYAIVIRIARRYRERQAREPRVAADEQSHDRSAEHSYLSREQLLMAQRALDALSDEKREAFVLAEVEQLSAPEIATITFTPLNTVYSRLRAARMEFERRITQLSQPRIEAQPGVGERRKAGHDE
jgi:RNA polymerase sigma-70 factor (ECF subfamily)